MDEVTFKDRTKRLLQVNGVIEKLDPAVRAAAFSLLEDYVIARTSRSPSQTTPTSSTSETIEDIEDEDARTAFFEKHGSKSPAQAAKAVAAYHYGVFGVTPMTKASIKKIAEDFGLILPTRPDLTLKVAKDATGKSLFKMRAGLITPTIYGEKFMKDKFGVKKGKGKPEVAE